MGSSSVLVVSRERHSDRSRDTTGGEGGEVSSCQEGPASDCRNPARSRLRQKAHIDMRATPRMM